jgi:hypothetical protein
MYLSLNDVARARNHLLWKRNKYYIFVCVCACVHAFVFVVSRVRVALLTLHAKRMRYIYFICALSGSTTFFEIVSQTARFKEKVNRA